MLAKHRVKVLLATGAIFLGSWFLPSIANGAEPQGPVFTLTSTSFRDGGILPTRIAFKPNAEFPFCFGENVSPQLSWANPQAGVRSFAITMFELEGGPAHTDLVVYGIPANVSSFAEGELTRPSAKFVGGKALRSDGTWHGMCPPPNVGTAFHHYQFRIRGTDLDPKELPPGLTAEELDAKLKGHTKGSSIMVALFKRPQ